MVRLVVPGRTSASSWTTAARLPCGSSSIADRGPRWDARKRRKRSQELPGARTAPLQPSATRLKSLAANLWSDAVPIGTEVAPAFRRYTGTVVPRLPYPNPGLAGQVMELDETMSPDVPGSPIRTSPNSAGVPPSQCCS